MHGMCFQATHYVPIKSKTSVHHPFIPEFLKLTLPSLNLDMTTDANWGFSLKSKTEWQTVLILIRWLIMSCLIWIYADCTSICFGLPGCKG